MQPHLVPRWDATEEHTAPAKNKQRTPKATTTSSKENSKSDSKKQRKVKSKVKKKTANDRRGKSNSSSESTSVTSSQASRPMSSNSRQSVAPGKRIYGYQGKPSNYRSSYKKYAPTKRNLRRTSSRRRGRPSHPTAYKPWVKRPPSRHKHLASTSRPKRQGSSVTATKKAVPRSSRTMSQRQASLAKTSASSSSASSSLKSMTSAHDFRNLKEWDTNSNLRKYFFDKVPGCFIDDDLVKAFTEEQLPSRLDKPADYAKWLGLSERFTPVGRAHFNDHFVPYAVSKLTKEYGKEAVNAIKPDLTLANVQPAVTGVTPTVDPYVETKATEGKDKDGNTDGEKGDVGDMPEKSPYLTNVKEQQVTMSKETREHYRQLALKEADQRQLLMLLCGNVEAGMFVDKKGMVRAPPQIIEHTLFLLQPYRMSNTIVGEIMQWINLGVNITWKNGYTIVSIVTLTVGITLAIKGLCSVYLMMVKGKSLPSRLLHGTANILMHFVQYAWTFFCSFFSRKYLPRHRVNQLSQRDYNKWLRILTTVGFTGLCVHVGKQYRPDYNNKRRLNIAQYAVQMVMDRYNQVQAMNYLAQLTPGIIGDDVSSGISERRLGLMVEVQKHFIDLDKEVDELTNDRVSELFNKFVVGDGELTEYKVDLGIMMMARFQQSRTSEDTDVQNFRKQLLEAYPQEMRCFHFLDAYGHPRNVTDICKVFFIYWKRTRESQLIPTIPHQGGSIAKWFDMTPTKFTPIARSFAAQRKKRSSASEELMNTPDYEWWRQHAYLYKSAKNPISLRHVLQEKPPSTAASLTPEALEQVKRYSGWTHRISKFTIASLVDNFQLSVNRLDDEYKQYVEVVNAGKGVKGVEWEVSREGMGFGMGTVKEAEAQRLEEEKGIAKQDKQDTQKLELATAEFYYRTLNQMWQTYSHYDTSDFPPGFELDEDMLHSPENGGFYAAIADDIGVTEDTVRKSVVNYLCSNWKKEHIRHYLPKIKNTAEIQDYTKRILNTRIRIVDYVEMKAVANLYNRTINIFQLAAYGWTTYVIQGMNSESDEDEDDEDEDDEDEDDEDEDDEDEDDEDEDDKDIYLYKNAANYYLVKNIEEDEDDFTIVATADETETMFNYFSYDTCFKIARSTVAAKPVVSLEKVKIRQLHILLSISRIPYAMPTPAVHVYKDTPILNDADNIIFNVLNNLPDDKLSLLDSVGLGSKYRTFINKLLETSDIEAPVAKKAVQDNLITVRNTQMLPKICRYTGGQMNKTKIKEDWNYIFYSTFAVTQTKYDTHVSGRKSLIKQIIEDDYENSEKDTELSKYVLSKLMPTIFNELFAGKRFMAYPHVKQRIQFYDRLIKIQPFMKNLWMDHLIEKLVNYPYGKSLWNTFYTAANSNTLPTRNGLNEWMDTAFELANQ